MTTQGIRIHHTGKVLDATTLYLQVIDNALVEAEHTVAQLRVLRGSLLRDVLGEAPRPGSLSEAMQAAGPGIPDTSGMLAVDIVDTSEGAR